ncbi:flagellar hook capping FlgD N-terminal domain-containing protein [Pseudaestuariivita rosea]|uniref:flagellar hook capping FlgD N-terminal domain-containing protein n=1 Tax=Pseudaestuariivita rosea TaxID=2763263 RepID=UPI001ABB4978|nr:flagellar hook capping FlgD N-terminal domain-containing protein [Pseudaestuariivita rosea]
MEINTNNQTFSNNTTASTSSSNALSGDLETFLTLLTSQIENQDPLEPVDSTEYVAQLASFSQVEQQVTTNELLEAMTNQLNFMNMGDMAGWVGMEARVAAPAYFDGEPITISPNPVAAANQAFLVVRDENGNQVQRREIPVSSDPFEWSGVGNSGTFESGLYQFEIESVLNDEVVSTDVAEIYGTITEVRGENGTTTLLLEGDVRVTPENITGLRQGG